jgi:hypothetical protein
VTFGPLDLAKDANPSVKNGNHATKIIFRRNALMPIRPAQDAARYLTAHPLWTATTCSGVAILENPDAGASGGLHAVAIAQAGKPHQSRLIPRFCQGAE